MKKKNPRVGFKRVMELRKLIQANSHTLFVDARARGIELGDSQHKRLVSICKNQIIPGMEYTNILKSVEKAVQLYLDQIIESENPNNAKP